MVLQKAMSDYFWGLWSIVQHANGNPAAEFWSYATGRFERCKTLMSGGEFSRHLEAVSAGYRPRR
jgi:hypothetical protein